MESSVWKLWKPWVWWDVAVCVGEVNSYEMWSCGYEGTPQCEGLSFLLWEMDSPCLSSFTFPHSCGWRRMSTYTRTLFHFSSYTQTHIKAFTHALTNTNCSHLTVIWTDMFTLLLIWMSLQCLASFAILKIPLRSLSKLQADGDESAWLSLRSCESCFFFPHSVYFRE